MPQGPGGAPRFTELLPFSSDEVDVEVEEQRTTTSRFFPKELRELLNSLDVTADTKLKVDKRVIVKQKPDARVSIIQEIAKELSELGERASSITYYVINNDIGYISSTRTDNRFRRRGLASELRQDALNDMESIGVDVVYSLPASSAGRALAESQGFTESEVEGYLSKEL